jgi:hypothetical protein
MAYPFAPTPTYREFKARLQSEFDCKFVKLEGELIDPQGRKRPVYYFERFVNGKPVRVAAPDLTDDTCILFSVMRSVCTRLDIPASAFGLNLGWVVQ